MNDIPNDLSGFDFLWSCDSLEHIGGLEHGLKFIENAMACLRAGGITVHTTEFTLASNEESMNLPICLFTEGDRQELTEQLCTIGYALDLNLTHGRHQLDQLVLDEPPPWEISLKEHLFNHTITSFGLFIHKPE